MCATHWAAKQACFMLTLFWQGSTYAGWLVTHTHVCMRQPQSCYSPSCHNCNLQFDSMDCTRYRLAACKPCALNEMLWQRSLLSNRACHTALDILHLSVQGTPSADESESHMRHKSYCASGWHSFSSVNRLWGWQWTWLPGQWESGQGALLCTQTTARCDTPFTDSLCRWFQALQFHKASTALVCHTEANIACAKTCVSLWAPTPAFVIS